MVIRASSLPLQCT